MALLLALLLPGCAVYNFVLGGPRLRDIRVESAEITDLFDRPESWPTARQRPPLKLIGALVVISTPRSLVDYTERYNYTMYNEVSICQNGNFSKLQIIPSHLSILYTGGSIGAGGYGPGGPQHPDPDGRYRSYFFIDMPRPGDSIDDGERGLPFYDLSKERNDLCFHIAGGTMWGTTHDSGSVLIPDALIKEALDRAAAAAAP